MDVRDHDIGLLQGVPMLTALPLPAIERLARGLEPVVVPAGEAVFDQAWFRLRPPSSVSSQWTA